MCKYLNLSFQTLLGFQQCHRRVVPLLTKQITEASKKKLCEINKTSVYRFPKYKKEREREREERERERRRERERENWGEKIDLIANLNFTTNTVICPLHWPSNIHTEEFVKKCVPKIHHLYDQEW